MKNAQCAQSNNGFLVSKLSLNAGCVHSASSPLVVHELG